MRQSANRLAMRFARATEPELRLWKVPFSWMAVGYYFGPVISGVRVYTSFPF